MPKLAVNVDHIATIREARKTSYPDPVTGAMLAELAGADAIVVHLREDRRHIQERDVLILRQTVQTRLILEMSMADEMLEFALSTLPDMVTLVPERREELTTEGGLDVVKLQDKVKNSVETLKSAGIPVCLFIDPEIAQVEASLKTGASHIELHTGAFCDANLAEEKTRLFNAIVNAAKRGKKLGLSVNAGHGLCYKSIQAFTGIKEIEEYSIGHSIISYASLIGMKEAVGSMLELVRKL